MFNMKEFLDLIEKNHGMEARSQAMHLLVTGRIPEEFFINFSKQKQPNLVEQYLNAIEMRLGKETCMKVMSLLEQGHLGMDMLATLAGEPTENSMIPEEVTGLKGM